MRKHHNLSVNRLVGSIQLVGIYCVNSVVKNDLWTQINASRIETFCCSWNLRPIAAAVANKTVAD